MSRELKLVGICFEVMIGNDSDKEIKVISFLTL